MSETFVSHVYRDIPTHTISTNKYKTNFITLYIRQPLEEEQHTKIALIPSILKRGSVRYPSSQKLRQALDDLYGATLTTEVLKRGEEQVVAFRLQLANETYLSDTTPLFDRGIALLNEILMNPVLEGEAFKQKNVDLEKDLLKRKLSQIKDDKMRYANKRCIEEMFRHERYGLYAYGSADQIDGITAEDLYTAYRQMLATHPVECFVIGDLPEAYVRESIEKNLALPRGKQITIPETDVYREVDDVRTVTESTKISQGKLHIGCRTQTAYKDEDLVPLLVYNGVFGGFSHSKLFRNVREKESLAYYVGSNVESHKGFMTILSGIDFKNYEKTVQIIKQEMQNVKDGHISDEEIKQTKAMLTNQVKESNDQPFQLMDRFFNGIVGGKVRTSDELLSGIEAVTKEDIQRVANKVEMDTIYFLTGEESEVSA
jgi:predicted Zn-dependent peptidase